MARRRCRKNRRSHVHKKVEHASVVASNNTDAATVLASNYVLQTIRHMLVAHEMLQFLLICTRLAPFTFAFLRYRFCGKAGGIVPPYNFVSLHVESSWTFDPRSCYPALQELEHDSCDQEWNHDYMQELAAVPYEMHFPRLRKLSICTSLSEFNNTFALPPTLTALRVNRRNGHASSEDHFLNFQKALPSSLLDLRLTMTFNVASFLLPPQLERFQLNVLTSLQIFRIALPFPQQLRILKMYGHGPKTTADLPPTLEKLCLYDAVSLASHISHLTNLCVLKIPYVVIREPLPQSLRILRCREFYGPPACLNRITSLSFSGITWYNEPAGGILPHLSSLTELDVNSTSTCIFQMPPTVLKLTLPSLMGCPTNLFALQHLHLRSLFRAEPNLLARLSPPQLMKISFAVVAMSSATDVLEFCRYNGLNLSAIEHIFVIRVPRSALILQLCVERSVVGESWDRLSYLCGICKHTTLLSPNDDLVLGTSRNNSLACSSCTAHRAREE